MFEAISKNKFKSGLIVTLVAIFLYVIIYFIAYFSGLGEFAITIAVVISIASSLISYYSCDKIVLKLSNARPADDVTDRKLKNILEGICVSSGLPMPKLYIMNDPSPNAFATGRNPKNAVVCVTTGLLETMDYYELEGVLAHEMGHIKNYDILLSTVVTVFVGIAVMLSDIWTRSIFWGRSSSRRNNDNDNGGIVQLVLFVIGLIFIILAPIAGQLMQMALSRNREYLADATAIEFTRNPDSFISALRKLDNSVQAVKKANRATASMYIVNPMKSLKGQKASNLFSTHPPIADRIKALENLR